MADFSSFLGGANKLFENETFLKALAQAGTMVDPHGAGAAIGKPTIGAIESRQAAKAAEKQDAMDERRFQQLITALGGKVDYDENGKTKSITGNTKLAPEMLERIVSALGGGGQSILPGNSPIPPELQMGGRDQESLGSLDESQQPIGDTSDSVADMDTLLDNMLSRFGLGIGGL
jgi:hypothetical protein